MSRFTEMQVRCIHCGNAVAITLVMVVWTTRAPAQLPEVPGSQLWIQRFPPEDHSEHRPRGDSDTNGRTTSTRPVLPPIPVQPERHARTATIPSASFREWDVPKRGVPWDKGVKADQQGDTLLREFQSRFTRPNGPERWWHPEDPLYEQPLGQPWWDADIRQPLGSTDEALRVDIDGLITGALQHSLFVRVISATPKIQETELLTQTAVFDWNTFLESTYTDVNEPVGSLLVTGTDADRYTKQDWSVKSGLRRRNSLGGEVEASQRFGGVEDNSRFLNPNPQNATRLVLQYTQPLLKGSGRAYNQSLIVLGQVQLDKSRDAVVGELQTHLVRVTEAYWELYRTRAEFLQRQKLLAAAQEILQNLEGRREVDAVERQALRARTSVANRESEMLRAETRIRDWQARLQLLVNDPVLVHAEDCELLPTDSPLLQEVPLSINASLRTALHNRSDISQAVRDAHAASVKLGVSRKELLPKLDLVASSYIAGLAGPESGQAFSRQFSDGRPTYSVGLQFEVPLGNRAAKGQARRREWELDQAMSRYSLTVQEAFTAVDISVREVQTSYRELLAKHKSLQAADAEARYLNDRWRVLPSINDSAAQLLEALLEAQERVTDEEQALVATQVNYALSLVRLKGELGTLLRATDHGSMMSVTSTLDHENLRLTR